jgi:hypothetical protein
MSSRGHRFRAGDVRSPCRYATGQPRPKLRPARRTLAGNRSVVARSAASARGRTRRNAGRGPVCAAIVATAWSKPLPPRPRGRRACPRAARRPARRRRPRQRPRHRRTVPHVWRSRPAVIPQRSWTGFDSSHRRRSIRGSMRSPGPRLAHARPSGTGQSVQPGMDASRSLHACSQRLQTWAQMRQCS